MSTAGKVITCKAAVTWAPNEVSVETIQVDPPKAGEVRVKILHSGVCHSDAFIQSGVEILLPNVYPCILGHEGAGIVESVGPGVTSVAPGDHVIPLYVPQCGKCEYCKHPKANGCEAILATSLAGLMPDNTSRFTCNGKTIHHYYGTSTFSQYTVVAEISLAKVNPAAPLDKICLIGCAISTGHGSAVNIAEVTPGSTCAVWGLGAVGLAAVMGCREAGAKRIIGIDINPAKFNDRARKLGCTEFLNPKDHSKPVHEVLYEMTNGVGLDFAFECVGNPEAIEASLESVRSGWGVAVIVGLTPVDKKVSFKCVNMIFGKTWKGGLCGGYKGRDSMPKMVEKYQNGTLMVDEFITHRMPLDKIQDAYDYLHAGKSIRTVLNLHE